MAAELEMSSASSEAATTDMVEEVTTSFAEEQTVIRSSEVMVTTDCLARELVTNSSP